MLAICFLLRALLPFGPTAKTKVKGIRIMDANDDEVKEEGRKKRTASHEIFFGFAKSSTMEEEGANSARKRRYQFSHLFFLS